MERYNEVDKLDLDIALVNTLKIISNNAQTNIAQQFALKENLPKRMRSQMEDLAMRVAN